MHTISIFSDGTPAGTKIITEAGEEIAHVIGVDVHMAANEFAEVVLNIRMPAAQITNGTVTEIVFECPVCGHGLEHKCHDPGGDPTLGRINPLTGQPNMLPVGSPSFFKPS